MSNVAAETTQKIRTQLALGGWKEVKSQHFQFPGAKYAIEVGYVLGECTVKFLPIDERGAEGAMHRRQYEDRRIERGVGQEFIDKVALVIVEIEADAE